MNQCTSCQYLPWTNKSQWKLTSVAPRNSIWIQGRSSSKSTDKRSIKMRRFPRKTLRIPSAGLLSTSTIIQSPTSSLMATASTLSCNVPPYRKVVKREARPRTIASNPTSRWTTLTYQRRSLQQRTTSGDSCCRETTLKMSYFSTVPHQPRTSQIQKSEYSTLGLACGSSMVFWSTTTTSRYWHPLDSSTSRSDWCPKTTTFPNLWT